MPQQQTKEPVCPSRGVALVSDAPDNAATIALLERWAEADATDDPTAIAEAERDLAEFKASLNANRLADRPVFP